jgi:EAL domain-containing protein (putative c-di-GMP-specific phosphodiesterase class I)/CheY-like chemotaxis protein
MLSGVLMTGGYKVVLASFGYEAIERVKEPVDLILIDLMLNDMEGIELCHYLRRSDLAREIPIIVISETARNSEKAQCFQLGADEFITEPLDSDALLISVEHLMETRSLSHPMSPRRGERFRELRRLLDNQLIEPYFQPIYILDPIQFLGVEVLSRPQSDSILKSPELLFETALEFGFYFDLEMMVWKKALNTFHANGYRHKLFLNCSPHLVESEHYVQVENLFKDTVTNVKNVFFELTERSAIAQHQMFYQQLGQYRKLGIKIAVDDVGSGYSSLEAIVETRPEVVKIDRSIVHNLVEDPYKCSIVKFIVSFCREHDIICVAEGVETKEELHAVKNLGVNACQGYYFYRPTPHLDVSAFQAIII